MAIFTLALKIPTKDSKERDNSPSKALKYLTLFSKLVVPNDDFSKISQPTCFVPDADEVTNLILAILINSLEVFKVKESPFPEIKYFIPAASNSLDAAETWLLVKLLAII